MINTVRVDEPGVIRPAPRRPVETADTVEGRFTDVEDGDPDGPADEAYLDAAIL